MEERTTIQVSEDLRKELRLLAAKKDVSYQELLRDMISVFKELDKNKTIISVPRKLSNKIKTNIRSTDISSVSEYVTFVLRSVLSEEISGINFDEEKIKKRLKSLGYLD